MKKLLTILFFLLISLLNFGQVNMNSGIIYGKNFSYMLTAPDGWVLDNTSGVSQGLYAVFYKKGESWSNAEVVMYSNTASLESEPHKNLEQLIKYDIDNFKTNYTGINVTDGKDIIIKKDLIAKVKYLSGESYKNFEAMAYIDAGKNGIMIIMSSRTKKGFENSLSAFESIVKSYFFMTDKVEVEKKKE